MNFDYAGNLVVTGDNVVCIYTMPIAENVTTTPAKKALAVGKGDFVITNVETLRDDKIVKALLKSKPNKFDMIVVDEIHTCKSSTSSQGSNLLKLVKANPL